LTKTGNKSKIKVALDISPTKNQNAKRGVGFYTSRVAKALQELIKKDPRYHAWQIDLVADSNPSLSLNYDLIHYPYFDPFFSTLPKIGKTPTIVTVHDLIPLKFKKQYPVGIKGSFRWQGQKKRLKKASFIITDSHSSKYDISNLTHYPPERIYPIYLAADPIFRPLPVLALKKIKEKYNLPSQFVLYVGDINWNKNIPNLIKACEQLNYPLFIAGSSATQKDVPLHPWTKDLLWLQEKFKSSSPKNLKALGFVPDEDLAGIYSLATLYCQPSYAEGFGLPLLEAMASGCPTVYSSQTSLPEVADYCGEFFDPWEKHDLQKSLKKVWESPSLQKSLVQKGLKRSTMFTWEKTALQTIGVYELALN